MPPWVSTIGKERTWLSGASPSVGEVPAPRPVPARGTRDAQARGTQTRDTQRARVYRAEDAWGDRLDAARQGAALAIVGGSSLLLPAERRLGSLEAAAAYAARVLALAPVVELFGIVPPPRLRTRRGGARAHWESPGTIALPVPTHGEPWALRETVLLHELAHHVGETTGRCSGHRPPFPAVLLALVDAVLGAEAAFVLRVEYGERGVGVGAL